VNVRKHRLLLHPSPEQVVQQTLKQRWSQIQSQSQASLPPKEQEQQRPQHPSFSQDLQQRQQLISPVLASQHSSPQRGQVQQTQLQQQLSVFNYVCPDDCECRSCAATNFTNSPDNLTPQPTIERLI
jgi:hypothetical protein